MIGRPSTPADRLRARIAERGAIPFAELMEEALYGEGGYYGRPDLPIGEAGDYVTGSSLSPLFGRATGRLLSRLDAILGTPAELLEAGFGTGDHLAAARGFSMADRRFPRLGPRRPRGSGRRRGGRRSRGGPGALDRGDDLLVRAVRRPARPPPDRSSGRRAGRALGGGRRRGQLRVARGRALGPGARRSAARSRRPSRSGSDRRPLSGLGAALCPARPPARARPPRHLRLRLPARAAPRRPRPAARHARRLQPPARPPQPLRPRRRAGPDRARRLHGAHPGRGAGGSHHLRPHPPGPLAHGVRDLRGPRRRRGRGPPAGDGAPRRRGDGRGHPRARPGARMDAAGVLDPALLAAGR